MKVRAFMLLVAVVVAASVVMVSCTTPPEALPLPPEEQIIREIFEVDRPKDELFRLSMEWMAKTFVSAQDVIQYQDKEEGIIVGKGVINMRWGFVWPTHFTLTIEVKDDRARATFSDIYYVITVGSAEETGFVDNRAQLDYFGEKAGFEILASLESALKRGSDDW